MHHCDDEWTFIADCSIASKSSISRAATAKPRPVIPAKAGILCASRAASRSKWIPAFAGMTTLQR
jgi:hypothetical protein